MSCCRLGGIESFFDARVAEKELRRYRRRGPLPTTRLLLAALRAEGSLEGTLLDVGGGIGVIDHELLADGVSSATNVDVSPHSLAAAGAEAERRGHRGRLRLLRGDFVDLAPELEAADVVTCDRVVCCYPDMERLVASSAQKARRLYGAVYPRDVWWVRLALAAENLVHRARGASFRAFLHSPRAIVAALELAGLEQRSAQRTLAWEVVVFRRRVTA